MWSHRARLWGKPGYPYARFASRHYQKAVVYSALVDWRTRGPQIHGKFTPASVQYPVIDWLGCDATCNAAFGLVQDSPTGMPVLSGTETATVRLATRVCTS